MRAPVPLLFRPFEGLTIATRLSRSQAASPVSAAFSPLRTSPWIPFRPLPSSNNNNIKIIINHISHSREAVTQRWKTGYWSNNGVEWISSRQNLHPAETMVLPPFCAARQVFSKRPVLLLYLTLFRALHSLSAVPVSDLTSRIASWRLQRGGRYR